MAPSRMLLVIQILVLGVVQGAAELLPVSSSAHVIVVEKLMGLDPASPEMTFVLVMLHTGTMFAVIVYFWKAWAQSYFSSRKALAETIKNVVVATILTGVVGIALQVLIEKVFLKGSEKAEVESLFSQLPLIGGALAVAGVLIILAGLRRRSRRTGMDVDLRSACWVGAVQGLCLPFRGFSRSGATISTGLLLGVGRRRMEQFSFALAVVLTPVAIARELLRLTKAHSANGQSGHLLQTMLPGLIGMVGSFLAGLVALWLLSRWLEQGRWQYFGYYCLAAAAVVMTFAAMGY